MYKKTTKTTTIKESSPTPLNADTGYEAPEGIDIVLLDVPLMVKLLEYARSTATEVDLTNLAAKLTTKSNKWKSWKPLTEADYENIIAPTTTP